jgi:hypothetical protein
MRGQSAISVILLTIAAMVGFALPVFSATEKLFEASTAISASSADTAVMRRRAVEINFDALVASIMTFEGGDPSLQTIELNLFPDRSFNARLEQVEQPTPVNFAWVGRITDIEESQVVLVVGGGNMTGSITTPTESYRIRTLPDDRQVVEQVRPEALPQEADPIPVPPQPDQPNADQEGSPDDGSVFDLLVVYTPASRNTVGGTAAMQNLITTGVIETNLAYANSGIIPRLRLVHTAEVDYTEATDISIDLDRLRAPSDGFLDSVHALRNQHRADFVKLMVANPLGGCGIAFLMAGASNPGFSESAFSVTAQNCVTPNYTFGHELGHNMGCNHEPSDPTGNGAFSFSFGYKEPQSRFRTMMAYNCSTPCPRVLHFSNPSILFMGRPTGIPTQNNAQSINDVRRLVANFRRSL